MAQRPNLLIVEDETGPRDALKMILRPFFNLFLAENAHLALQLLKQHPIDLVTLDLKLPDRQGVDLLQDIKLEREDVEVIIITGYGSLKSAMDGIRFGAAGYLLKPFNVTELISLINQTLEKKQRLDRLRAFLKSSLAQWTSETSAEASWTLLSEQYFSMIQATRTRQSRVDEYSEFAPLLSDLLEAKSRDLFYHSCRVSCYAVMLGEQLALTVDEHKALAIGAFLHDIGRIVTDGRLGGALLGTDSEEALRRHPEVGARMILPLQLPAEVGQIISYHHERYDGSGYPYGLQGAGIPQLAQIVSLAQEFDHLLTDQAGQRPLDVDRAIEQIRQLAGSCFDYGLVEVFTRVMLDSKSTIPALVTSRRSAIFPKV